MNNADISRECLGKARNLIIRALACLVIISVAFITCSMQVFGASNKKTLKVTTYEDVIKSGNTVYVSGAGGIYRVNLKTSKVTKVFDLEEYAGSYVTDMKLYKGYLYFIIRSNMTGGSICRIKKNSKKMTFVASEAYMPDRYTFYKGKLYYGHINMDPNGEDLKYKSCSLSGKNKKSAKVKITVKHKKTNANGYSGMSTYKTAINDNDYEYYYGKDYLKKPDGKRIFLGDYCVDPFS